MTEEYASMKQIEFMKKLGFPPQSADLTKAKARVKIDEKIKEQESGPAPEHKHPSASADVSYETPGYPKMIDAPVVKVFGKMEEKDIKCIPTEAYIAPKEKEFHLSPEEVKCRALECAIEWAVKVSRNDIVTDSKALLEIADKFVKWIYAQ